MSSYSDTEWGSAGLRRGKPNRTAESKAIILHTDTGCSDITEHIHKLPGYEEVTTVSCVKALYCQKDTT